MLDSFVRRCQLIDNYIRSFKCSSVIQAVSIGTEQSGQEGCDCNRCVSGSAEVQADAHKRRNNLIQITQRGHRGHEAHGLSQLMLHSGTGVQN